MKIYKKITGRDGQVMPISEELNGLNISPIKMTDCEMIFFAQERMML
jgi:hypothetical protein